MKRWLPGLVTAVGVIIFGAGISGLAAINIIPNPLFTASYQVDLAGLASRAGFALGGIILLVIFITWRSQKRIDNQLAGERVEQNSVRQRFFQRLDHELKNPLTIIRLGLVNLQQSPDLGPESLGTLERVSVQAQRLQKLVVDLRLLSELEQASIEQKPVGLQDLLEEVISLVSEVTGSSRRIRLNVQQTPWPVSDVRGDRDLLVLVFRNLLDNALKFTTPENQVELRVTEDGHMAIVEVTDTGAGIPEEEIAHIFEELYRGENARGVPGSGLGLKLVQRIVELHHGTVQVRSRPGMGTVFTIRLPLASETM